MPGAAPSSSALASAPTGARSPARAGSLIRAVGSATIGNLLEMFDWIIAATFAAQIGAAFFPSGDPRMALLKAFAAYGVGFLARPLGAAVIGSYGDRFGRKSALVLTVTTMSLSTAATGLIPGYGSIGIWAPTLFVICRLIQGFSSGGEWGGAVAFLVEYSPDNRRGLYGGLQQGTVAIGLLGASMAAAALSAYFGPAEVSAWAWRIPFLFGAILAPVGYFIRKRTAETPAFVKSAAEHAVVAAPVRTSLRTQLKPLIQGLVVSANWTVIYYIFLVLMPSFAAQELKIQQTDSFISNALALVVVAICAPLSGLVSDRIGRRPVIVLGILLSLVAAYPLFAVLAARHDFTTLLWVQASAAAIVSLLVGPGPTFLCELFPTNLRYTSVSLSYNVAAMVFGALSPVGATWLVQATGQAIAPSYLIIGSSALALIPIALFRDRFRDAMR